MQIHGALLALHTGRAVRIVYGRAESFVGHVHRHPARMRFEHRATRDGRLTCVHCEILLDGGAYASSSAAVVSNACSFAVGPYAVPNALIEGTVVYTNNPPCGAMRGFGAVQTCFGSEAQMDLLAAELGMDPVELRLRNAIAPGDVLPTGQRITGSLPVAEVIRQAAALPVPEPEVTPRDPRRLPGGTGDTTRGEGVRRGIGFAVGIKNICFSEGFDDFCAARVVLRADGGAVVHCAAAEVGQGVGSVLLQVARTELATEDVTLAPHTTTTVGSAGSASASRMTWMATGAVRDACRAALAERAERGAVEVDVERIHRHPRTTPLDPANGQVTGERAHVAFAVCAMRVVAEVDEDLGLARVVWIGAAQDIGRALNPQAVIGQIEGGTAQGIGLALMEEILTRDGRIVNPTFTDYLLPTALDMPPLDIALIEDPEPGPALRRQGRRRAADRRLDGRRRGRVARRQRAAADARAGAARRHRAGLKAAPARRAVVFLVCRRGRAGLLRRARRRLRRAARRLARLGAPAGRDARQADPRRARRCAAASCSTAPAASARRPSASRCAVTTCSRPTSRPRRSSAHGREAASMGAALTFGVADFTRLPEQVEGTFECVLSCDNSVAHLHSDEDLARFAAGVAAKLRPGGLAIVSLRDYEPLVAERARGHPVRVGTGRRSRSRSGSGTTTAAATSSRSSRCAARARAGRRPAAARACAPCCATNCAGRSTAAGLERRALAHAGGDRLLPADRDCTTR